MTFLLSVIVTSDKDKKKGFILVDLDTYNLILQPHLDRATFFTLDFSYELHLVLERARESFSNYSFVVADLDNILIDESKVLGKHFDKEDLVND